MSEPITSMSELAEPAPPRQPWGFWGTCAWALLAFAVWLAAQIGAVVMLLWWIDAGPSELDFDRLDEASVITIGTVVAAPLAIAVVVAAARIARWPVRDYLALARFTRREFILGFACLIALGLIYDGAVYLAGRDVIPPVMVKMYESARDGGLMLPFVLAIAVVAPVSEELVFRGFIYRGWAASRLGAAGTILLTSVLFGSLHTQYEWDGMLLVFLIGLVFGWLRWRSGSTSLVIALHIIVNLCAIAQTAVWVEWLS